MGDSGRLCRLRSTAGLLLPARHPYGANSVFSSANTSWLGLGIGLGLGLG